eukprot:5565128-Amphidinium_carterae.1
MQWLLVVFEEELAPFRRAQTIPANLRKLLGAIHTPVESNCPEIELVELDWWSVYFGVLDFPTKADRTCSSPKLGLGGWGMVVFVSDTQERVWLPFTLEAIRLSGGVLSGCAGARRMPMSCQGYASGRRHPKGRNGDLEQRALNALLSGQRIRWIKAQAWTRAG